MLKFNLIKVLLSLSFGMDCVENDLAGVTTHHSKRVAYIAIVLGKSLGINGSKLIDLAACALLHDCALTEYVLYMENIEGKMKNNEKDVAKHCIFGENNIKMLKFAGDVRGAILYHHENADGTGAFKKKYYEISLYARIIHFADQIDVDFDLSKVTDEKYNEIIQYIKNNTDKLFEKNICDAFEDNFSFEDVKILSREDLSDIIIKTLPNIKIVYSNDDIVSFANFIAKIIDYKSKFTMKHSIGIAEKAMAIAKCYNYSEDDVCKLYFAGALHDIGKLAVNRDILEKPGKLTESEFVSIKSHALYTYKMLKDIEGLEEICDIASSHHEKLDGSGYPFGKKEEQLSRNDKIIAVIDIYQALIEERPYKKTMSHAEAIDILNTMARKNLIDGDIVNDVSLLFGSSKIDMNTIINYN